MQAPPRIEPDLGFESDERLANRLAWITGLRLGFLTLLLVATAFFYLRGALGEYPQSQGIVFATIGGAFALAAVYATVLRSGKHLRRLAEVQIVLDQLTWTAIVYVSGGATSGATSFYGLTCLVGAILIGLRGAALAAVQRHRASSSCSAPASRHGSIRPPRDQGAANYIVSWDGMVYPLAVNALGIVVVALLAGLSRRAPAPHRRRARGGQRARARRRAPRAARPDRRRPRARDPESARLDLGLDRDAARSARARRRTTGASATSSIARPARLNHLVSDMMDLAGPKKPEPEDVDVAALAREVVALASRSRSGAARATSRCTTAARTARCARAAIRRRCARCSGTSSATASRRPGRARASPSRSRPSATASRWPSATRGPGIAPDAVQKIFDAFYTTRAGGAGIGLAVVRRIIEDHRPLGASIEVRDGTEPGATFVVGLARANGPAKKNEDRDPGVAVAANAGSRR